MIECGLTNLGTCLPEMLFQFAADLLNSALQGLLDIVYSMMTTSVSAGLFQPIWEVMVYVISLFYGLFLIGAGFNFMISGHNAKKREDAKAWMANVVFMVLTVQSSYFLYDVVVNLAGTLTNSVINIINPDFFLINVSSFSSIGFELVMLTPYTIILIITMLLLGLRYIFLVLGVLLVPFAAFFYFIPPLRSYGKVILEMLLLLAFVPFFMSIVLFGVSKMSSILLFGGHSILVSTLGFLAIDVMMIVAAIFGVFKAAGGIEGTDFAKLADAALIALI